MTHFKTGTQLKATFSDFNHANMLEKTPLLVLSNMIQTIMSDENFTIETADYGKSGASLVGLNSTSNFALHFFSKEEKIDFELFSVNAFPTDFLLKELSELISSEVSISFCGQVQTEQQPFVNAYPDFNEYLLIKPPYSEFPKAEFRRGVGRSYTFEAEAVAWQKFFCSSDYAVPKGKDILLLHPCSWAKPYDMSNFITKLREVVDGTDRVHRVIISNVGVVPYEFQMNPYFCSYDYKNVYEYYSSEKEHSVQREYMQTTASRIERYIESKQSSYKAVVVLGHPFKGGYPDIVRTCAINNKKPGFSVPSRDEYLSAQEVYATERDFDSPLFSANTLESLHHKLVRLQIFLTSSGGPNGR